MMTLILILLAARMLTRGFFYRPMGGWFFGMPRVWRRPPMWGRPMGGFGFGPGPMGGFGPGPGGRRW